VSPDDSRGSNTSREPSAATASPGFLGGRVGQFLAGLTAIVLTAAIAACTGHNSEPQARFSEPASPSPTAAPCHLRVLENGFSADPLHEIEYGIIVENPCHEAAVRNDVVAHAVDRSGHTIVGAAPALSVILPGQTLGLAGTMNNGTVAGEKPYNPSAVARLKVEIDHSDWVPVDDLTKLADEKWPKAVCTDIHIGPRDSQGIAKITFNVKTDPKLATLLDPAAAIILRDRSGKIVAGHWKPASAEAGPEQTTLWVPPSTDTSRTEIYIVQNLS
jgi:hypothetical protein